MRSSGSSALALGCLASLLMPLVPSGNLQGKQDKAPRGTERTAAQGEKAGDSTDLSRADRYFAICDYDANTWINYAEAHASLGIDRKGFEAYDLDGDGLIVAREFRRRYEEIQSTGGVFLPPRAKAAARDAIPERADEALESYDKNGDAGLDTVELEVLLVKVGAVRMEAETTIEQIDRDLTRKLESAEIEDLLTLLKPASAASKGPRPKTIDELFGKLVPRALQEGSTTQPVRIMPPVRCFRRLDIDGDGVISLEDLAELQRPLVLPVRAPAVLVALDSNDDGAIDEIEFRTSMRSGP